MKMAFNMVVRSLALLICLAASFHACAHGRGASGDACAMYTQNRLVIGGDLQGRRFVLESKGDIELMPPFRASDGRNVFHRPFSLSLDVGERLSLFYSRAPRTCVLARDEDRQASLKIPVFFIGGAQESIEELKDNADSLAFAPSAWLQADSDFSDVSFHLRRGGSRFGEIRPFFLCGLAGLLVCEQSCPDDSTTLAASLVNEVVKDGNSNYAPSSGRREVRLPSLKEEPRPRQTVQPAEPAPQPKPAPRITPAPVIPQPRTTEAERQPFWAPSPLQPPAQPKPDAAARPEVVQSEKAVPPKVETPSQPEPRQAQPAGNAPAQPQKAEPAQPQPEPEQKPQVPEPAPAPAPAPPKTQRFVLAFERKNGEPLSAANVLKAEGNLIVEGAPLQLAPEGLAADLPEEAFQKAGTTDYLKKLLKRHTVISVKNGAGRFVLTVEPRYVRAEDLLIVIRDAAGEPVHGCDLALDVSMGRRLGDGWTKTGETERVRGLEYAEQDATYALSLPADIEPNELLISTAEPGDVGRISNAAPGCELEQRPLVSVDEVRSGKITRFLQKAGPTLIAIFSTDSTFAGRIGFAAADGFWSEALRLVNVVSTASWEKKVLARAQAPGVSPETGVLQQEGQGGALAGDGNRGTILKSLSNGSHSGPGPLSIFLVQPVERYHLDLALKPIREDASIASRHSVKQEALLLITGSVRETGSYFCQHSVRRDKSPWESPNWVRQARKIFAVEVWSETAINKMQESLRIKAADDAPADIYRCSIPGPEGDKIALYGLSTKALTDDVARTKAFSYLTTKANTFLKP
jgi:hypothetical protein